MKRANKIKIIFPIFLLSIIILATTKPVLAASYRYDNLDRLIEITYESGTKISYTYDSMGNILTVDTNKVTPLSNDTTLKSLTIKDTEKNEEITMDPTFDPNTHEYEATVPYDTEEITIEAIANNLFAEISGDIGKQLLDIGENIFTITVTAQDGSDMLYEIIILRDEEFVPILILSMEEWSPSEAEQSIEIIVTSNTSWSVSSDEDWLTVSPTSGTGDGIINISVSAN